MNIGLFISHSGIVSGGKVFQNEKNDDYIYLQEDNEIIEKINNDEMGYEDIFISGDLEIYKIPDFVPYLYTNDSVSFAEDQDQINKLLFNDLRETVYLNRKDHELIKEEKLKFTKNSREEFFNLQKENKILSINNKHANKLELNVDVKKTSMLVINEIYHPDWYANVDGNKQEVLRVNYLQQGLLLKEGRHRIILKFFPKKTVPGLLISLSSLIILAILIFFIYLKSFKKYQ